MAACGDEDEPEESGSSSATASGSGGKTPPTISGEPLAEVPIGATYSFKPSAHDADNDTLTFRISNKPSWAQFSTSSGRLSGKPQAGDENNYTGIRISVSDGRTTVELSEFSINVVSFGSGTASLSWTAPTENMDGTPLNDLAGFKVYWGLSPRRYDFSETLDGQGALDLMVGSLTRATWYFTVTAYNSEGVESIFSNEVTKLIQ